MDNVLISQPTRNVTLETSTIEQPPIVSTPANLSGSIGASSSMALVDERKSKTLEYIAKSMKVEQPKLVNLGEG